ncbi:MAG: hypothetical protein GY778_19620 [bacterium]|nr:hypothetical protein [bacterium]
MINSTQIRQSHDRRIGRATRACSRARVGEAAARRRARFFFGGMLVVGAGAVALAVGVAVVGCASVTVRKVPTPTQYVHWTDDMQRKADKMEGLRFYLPRPFLSVFESFPVRTDIYLANGVVSPDGKYVIVTSVTGESGLSRFIANDPRAVRIPRSYIFDEGAFEEQAGLLDEAQKRVGELLTSRGDLIPTGVVGQAAPATAPPAPPAAPAPQPTTGINQRTATNDNGAFAYQPLRGNFDLVYLPDFEEQFVVASQAGLGNAMFEINLGQGWSLQGFNSLVDNSELNRRIFDLIDTSMRLAKQAAAAALGIPPLPGLAPPAEGPGAWRPQAGEPDDAERLAGTPVSLKIVVVHYAAKGLYPVIKPRELQERITSQRTHHCFLDLFKLDPKVRGVSDYDPEAIRRAQMAVANEAGSYTVPRYPYQYVSFNAFRYMAIEVVQPTSEDNPPFKHLYDKTGTKGEEGQARTTEVVDLMNQLGEYFSSRRGDDGNDEEEEDEGEDDGDNGGGNLLEGLARQLADSETLRVADQIELPIAEARATADGRIEVTFGTPADRLTEAIDEQRLMQELVDAARELAPQVGIDNPESVVTDQVFTIHDVGNILDAINPQ